MKIGIFGGTFNPVHFGHLISAQDVLEEYQLDRILFVPSKAPVHKDIQGIVSQDDRLQMVEHAISGNQMFELSGIELNRESPSFTITTVRQIMKENPETEFYLVIGNDSMNEFHTWKDYLELLRLLPIIVMRREEPASVTGDRVDLPGQIHYAQNPFIDISSSRIRKLRKAGRSIRYLVPESVEKYIIEKGLYIN